MTTKIITAADVEAGLTADWCYSDAHKEVYGFRPLGHTAEQEAWFWTNFERLWADMQEEEAAQLEALREHHGIDFKSFMDYYDFLDEQYEIEYQQQREEEAAARAFLEAFFSPFSVIAVVEMWEHGDI